MEIYRMIVQLWTFEHEEKESQLRLCSLRSGCANVPCTLGMHASGAVLVFSLKSPPPVGINDGLARLGHGDVIQGSLEGSLALCPADFVLGITNCQCF